MPTEFLQKARATIIAQNNGVALTANQDPNSGSYTGSTPTVIDNTYAGGSENARGAYLLDLELGVTAAPTTATVAKIYYRTSRDNSSWTRWQYSHTIPASILTIAYLYRAGVFSLSANFTQIAVMAGYAFTAKLYATPIIPGESQ